METTKIKSIIIETTVNAPIDKVWERWTKPEHILHWNNASDDWFTPWSENDLRVGGKFTSRMEARDGSFGFNFGGIYTSVKTNDHIMYTMDDNRKVQVVFKSQGNSTHITETFEPESENSPEMQRDGWQSILDNFKKYVENSGNREILHFDININAPVKVVFNRMFEDKYWRLWTAEFSPTSHYKGSWEKGSKILFLGDDAEGNIGGMVSRIRENIPDKFVSIEHLGFVKDGEEITSGPQVEDWAGVLENYSFADHQGHTLLTVTIDSNQEFKPYFQETWPKALKKLKSLCETN